MDEPGRAGLARSAKAALDDILPPGEIGVAVSGGGDSMALLALAHGLGGRRIWAATVDHGLRAEAEGEARAVGEWCAARNIPHQILSIPPLDGPGNLQALAREARYGALARWARECGISAVLLGHTMDDQAETVLMRLARGSGAEGLAGMAARIDRDGVRWLRPLLGFRRDDLRDWLREQGISWAEDPSNDDGSFDRIKARRALETLAPLGITVEGLAATADRLRRQARTLRACATALEAEAVRKDGGTLVLDRAAVRAADPDTGMRLVADLLGRIGGSPYRPRFRSLEPLYARIAGNGTFRVTLHGCIVETTGAPETIAIRPEPAASRVR